MHFKIHRGTNEIGGSCLEVWTDNTRVVVDFGMPLVERDGTEFNFRKYYTQPIEELISNRILPEIEGLYNGQEYGLDAVLISHPHQDHYGFLNYINPSLKVYIGEAAYKLIGINKIFTSQDTKILNPVHFVNEKSFMIGDMEITAFLVDHSAFDAYAFLIKAGGKSLFYTGDFRGHGRKRKLFTKMILNPPENVDYLVMEGTSLGRNETSFKNEDWVEEKLTEIFSEAGKINIIYASGQNIDRIVSIFRACKRTGKIFVADIYVATILTMLSKYAKIPFPSKDFSNLKVIYSRYTSVRLAREDKILLYQQRHFKISKEEIGLDPSRYVMLVRPSMEVDLKRIANFENGNFIYSMWEGYLKKDNMIKFRDFFLSRSFTICNVHTSGHADVPTLKKLVKAIQPKYIVPMHTFHKHDYKDIFSVPVLELEDGEVYSEPAGSETSPV